MPLSRIARGPAANPSRTRAARSDVYSALLTETHAALRELGAAEPAPGDAPPALEGGGGASLADIMASWTRSYGGERAGEAPQQQADAWTPWSSPWLGLEAAPQQTHT